MRRTDSYRRQHDDLLQVAGEISGKLDTHSLSQNASEVRTLLSKLLGKLNVHLAAEDKALYPRLLNAGNPEAKSLAERYISEMGNIADVVKSYSQKWPSPAAIQKDPATFVAETKNLFGALSKRIHRENNELYNYVDKM
ncbi:MAG TPA: hemerythrin domain-containing protein [Caldithrix abyssi]|uniref:Hemerythrin domain-containing protein n=1 Tax=Caldithrix abyssi TaxID=187145 RepID=A0A7V5VEB5_CALAY|nr:hemerythrin domain-containing protein [Caldithrix abyssi]